MRLSKILIAIGIFGVLLTGCGKKEQESPKNQEERILSGSEEEAGLLQSAGVESSALDYGKTDISTMEGIIEEQAIGVTLDGSRSIYSQLGIMADNMDIWYHEPDYADDLYCFAVTNLDLDDRLELIVANYGGTGEYTYSHFYEINESYDGLTECETNFAEGESQPDIIEEFISVFCDAKGIFHYIFFDNLRIGAGEDDLITSALTLQNGKITNDPLRCMRVTYGEEQGSIAYTNGAGDEITEEEYKNAVENAFEGLTSYTVTFGWQDAGKLEGLSREEVTDKLEESYNKFKHGTE